MSEPVTNSEIEDVLSSIRRLVSEDTRRVAEPPRAPGRPGRLVLTPAQRVEDEDTTPAPEPEAEPDILQQPERDVWAEDGADETRAWPGEGDDRQDAEAGTSAGARRGLEAKIAELEALIGRGDEAWEPEEAGQSDYAGDATEALEWEDASDLAGPDGGHAHDLHDADEAETARWSVEELDTEDAAPDEAEDEPGGTLFDDETGIIDEALLREMLTEVVREELQGALGERITRNVRKLVRREIHRALAARDFD